MAELVALGVGIGAMAYGLAGRLMPKEEKQPVYTLTPPVFDRIKPDAILTTTPLETYLHPRRQLFTNHYTGDNGEHLLDVRLAMAPSLERERNDVMAHIYLPKSQPGVPTRPIAEARFHVQHSYDANSFTNFILTTEGRGSAAINGAVNLTSAIKRIQEQPEATTADAKIKSAVVPTPKPIGSPQGLSAFFNLPLLRVPGSAASAAPAAPVVADSSKPFEPKPILRGESNTFGLRYDQPAVAGRTSSYSVGVHCDPFSTYDAVKSNHKSQVQVSSWLASETENFRMAAETSSSPFVSALPLNSAGVNGRPEGVLVDHPVASIIPPRLATSLPALLSSRLGLFYTPSRASKLRPGYEVGVTLSNDSRGRQELVASYFHHLVVRRNIKNPFEKKENRAINNYIDLGMEVVYRNDESASIGASNAPASLQSRASIPPSLRFGASWQLNKNSLVKFRVQDANVSFLYAFKSWWEPSASAAISVNHGFHTNSTSFGLSLNLENIGEVLWNRPDPSYRRMIANQKENIANLIEEDEDY